METVCKAGGWAVGVRVSLGWKVEFCFRFLKLWALECVWDGEGRSGCFQDGLWMKCVRLKRMVGGGGRNE